jgi:predicted RNase H-like HicB family nuclease
MKRHPEYLVVIEKEGSSFGAYVPDLPGCVAVGKTRARVRKLIEGAIALHLEDLRATGQSIPRPAASFELIRAA